MKRLITLVIAANWDKRSASLGSMIGWNKNPLGILQEIKILLV